MTAMKRYLTLLIALAAAMFLFSSCGNQQQGNNQSGGDNAIVTVAPDAQLEDLGTFTVLVQDNGAYASATANDIVKQHLINRIANERNQKIDMNVIPVPAGDFINQANTYIQSGQQIDGFSVEFGATSDTLLSAPGWCIPIDTLLQQYGPNVMMVIGDSYWQTVMRDNQIMGIPSTAFANETIMIARRDVLNMMGIESVQTRDELLIACEVYKAWGKIPLALTWSQVSELLSYSYGIPAGDYELQNNAVIMRENADYFYFVYTNDHLTEISYFINQMRRFYNKGYFDKDLFTASAEDMRSKFISGEAMVYATEAGNVYGDLLALRASDPAADIMVIPSPTSQRMKTPTIRGEKAIDRVLLFASSGANHRAMMTFKDWMYSDQTAYMDAMYGAIGTHISFNPYEGTYSYLEGNSPDAQLYTGLYSLGIDLDGIFPMPRLLSSDPNLAKRGEIQKEIYDYLSRAQVRYELSSRVKLTDQNVLEKMATYRYYMDEALMLYVTGQINDFDFQRKMNSLIDEGTYVKEYLVASLTQQ